MISYMFLLSGDTLMLVPKSEIFKETPPALLSSFTSKRLDGLMSQCAIPELEQ